MMEEGKAFHICDSVQQAFSLQPSVRDFVCVRSTVIKSFEKKRNENIDPLRTERRGDSTIENESNLFSSSSLRSFPLCDNFI